MSMCGEIDAGSLTSLCPNLEQLLLSCAHLEQGTISNLVNRLPLLTGMTALNTSQDTFGTSPLWLTEADILALRGLETVGLAGVSAGVDVAARVGSPVTHIINFHICSNGDAAMDLVKCPRLVSLCVGLSVAELKRLPDAVPHLPRLVHLVVGFGVGLTVAATQDASIAALSIVRICDHPLRAVTFAWWG